MNRNIIDAIGTLIMRKPFYLDGKYFTKEHSIDRRWTLEVYVRDLFADSFDAKDFDEKVFRHGEVFSYSGNLTNPPDLMLNGGDAIEIKNIYIPERITEDTYSYFFGSAKIRPTPLILNTVYPRQKLFANDPLISKPCRQAETWKEKDIIYAVGVSKGKQLTHFCMVYGQDYCASAKYYKEILTEMRAKLKDIPNIHFSDERYLGRVKATDPTGATYVSEAFSLVTIS